jgi:hypothetical protein
MRLNLTLLFLLFLGLNADAQKLTGIWRGYFTSSGGIYQDGGLRGENYKYEVQIEQMSNNSVDGVTYSYKTTVFYGKAKLQGIYSPASKNLIIKETHLQDLKIGDKSDPCLMTCYLDYSKIGKLEVLQGTFISINIKDKGDCGSGTVYLEKVPTSDFELEDFLAKKSPAAGKKPSGNSAKPDHSKIITRSNPEKSNKTAENKKASGNTIKPNDSKAVTGSNTGKTNKPAGKLPVPPKKKPAVTPETLTKKAEEKKEIPGVKQPESAVTENAKKDEAAPTILPEKKAFRFPAPRVLLDRENKLVRTITTSQPDIKIDFWDNSVIDNDTITVYHNNEMVIKSGRLSDKPITVRIKCSKDDDHHEIVVVADNLGDIPPNTALMVVTAGRERYEVFLASNEKTNAKVVINYVPKE